MIKVVDNFYSNPEAEYTTALNAQYKSIQNEAVVYPTIAISPYIDSLERFKDELGGQNVLFSLPPFYRKYSPLDVQPSYVHSDISVADYTAIIFLNKKSIEGMGTAFWRHKATDLLGFSKYTPKEVVSRVEIDTQDDTKWELSRLVEHKYNRAIIFSAGLFHSRYPKTGWDTELGEDRLVKVVFLRRR